MSIVRVGPWSIGDKLTTAQINAIDLNGTFATDKRSGQTDTVQSILTCSNAGRLIKSYVAGANTNNSYALSGGCSFIDGSAATISGANVTYTLLATGATLNDTVEIRGHATKPIIVVDAVSSATLVALLPQAGAEKALAELYFNGTNWVLKRVSGNRNLTVFSQFMPEYWTGVNASSFSTIGSLVIATDESAWAANFRLTRKDLAADLFTGNIDSVQGYQLPCHLTGLTAYGAALDANQLIDGKTLTSVSVERTYTGGSGGDPSKYMWFWLKRRPAAGITAASYLSSATYPGGSGTVGSGGYTGPSGVTMTCNQNNVIDLSLYVYQIIIVMGPARDGFGTASSIFNGALFTHQ